MKWAKGPFVVQASCQDGLEYFPFEQISLNLQGKSVGSYPHGASFILPIGDRFVEAIVEW